MNELSLASFQDIKIFDGQTLDKALSPSNKMLSNYNFSNLYIWGEIYKSRWKFYKERLVLYDGADDFISSPIGEPFTPKELAEISDNFIGQGKSGRFMFVEPEYIEKNKDIADFFSLEIDEDYADYIYKTQKLVELKGKKLHKKKNLVSQFLRNNPIYNVNKLEKKYSEECFKLAEKWCKDRNCEKMGFKHEKSALGRALDKFDELGLQGLIMFVKDKMIAFSIFSEQNKNTADIHFEKYDSELKGCEQVICWESAKYLLPRYEYLNREEDLGLEGLRQSKKSYEPEFILKTYKLYRK